MAANGLRRLVGLGGGKALPTPEPLALLLGRISFGITEAEWARAKALGYQAYLEEQLSPASLDDSVLEATLARELPTLALDIPALLAYGEIPNQQNRPLSDLVVATLGRQIFSRRQLQEVMTEFWSNHFSVFHLDGPVRYFKSFEDRVAVRPHALGKFRDLLFASARSPAMLWYLDNYANTVGVAQENYARELLELHTLGADGGYTEDDVREFARALTGWTINPRASDGFAFVAARHDTGAKSVLGLSLAAGRGIEDATDVLNLLATHPSTARFVCTKLVRRFVADDPPAALVERLKAEFIASDGDIKSLLRMIFSSPEFAASADAKFKRPAEQLISMLRVTEPRFGTDYVRILTNQLEATGQLPFRWDPPDGYPDRKDHWLNSTALLNRWNFGFDLIEGRLAPRIQIDETRLAGSARTPAELVDRLTERFLRRPLSASDREVLIAYAAGAQPVDAAFTKQEREYATTAVAGVLLASDYFQYR